MTPSDIKQIRLKLGWSQKRLAEALGVTRNAVNQWEMGIRAISEPVSRLITIIAKKPKAN